MSRTYLVEQKISSNHIFDVIRTQVNIFFIIRYFARLAMLPFSLISTKMVELVWNLERMCIDISQTYLVEQKMSSSHIFVVIWTQLTIFFIIRYIAWLAVLPFCLSPISINKVGLSWNFQGMFFDMSRTYLVEQKIYISHIFVVIRTQG